ncbi:MAG: SURF1 family cytochrome oxidase biogenesis protein, partial [Pseudomonadota bacterium]
MDTARRPLWFDALIVLLAAVILVSLVLLGNWQMRRLDWKVNLIEAVESRAYSPAVAPPQGPIHDDEHAYLRVALEGRYIHRLSRRVKALTELGGGHWLLTPLQTERSAVWVNRGFVPTGTAPAQWLEPDGPQRIEGLLRITEPGGTLLEKNNPDADRWVSRDVDALSQ